VRSAADKDAKITADELPDFASAAGKWVTGKVVRRLVALGNAKPMDDQTVNMGKPRGGLLPCSGCVATLRKPVRSKAGGGRRQGGRRR